MPIRVSQKEAFDLWAKSPPQAPTALCPVSAQDGGLSTLDTGYTVHT